MCNSFLTGEKSLTNGVVIEYYYDEIAESPFNSFDTDGKYFLPQTRKEGGIDTGGFGSLDAAMEAAKVCADNGGPIGKLYRWNNRVQVVLKSDILKDEDEDGEVVWRMDGEPVEQWEGVCFVEKDQSADILKADIDLYNYWTNGEVYGYIIKNANGEEVDSCWGFYGWDDVEEAAEDAASGVDPYLTESFNFGGFAVKVYKEAKDQVAASQQVRYKMESDGDIYIDPEGLETATKMMRIKNMSLWGIVKIGSDLYPRLICNNAYNVNAADEISKGYDHFIATYNHADEIFARYALLNSGECWYCQMSDDIDNVTAMYATKDAAIIAALKEII